MRQALIFKELLLLSERDLAARAVTFGPTQNLLLGKNETGKSRVLKHLFWALGCELVKKNAGGFDSNVIAAVTVQLGKQILRFVRQGKSRAAFNGSGELIFATERPDAWSTFFAQEFDYGLKLQRHDEGQTALAGPEYAFLPSYIDQDASWANKWATFSRLSQFANWQAPVFDSFTGLRPIAFFEAKARRDVVAAQLRELKRQEKAQNTSYERLAAMLPAESVQIDEASFDEELRSLASDVESLAFKQEAVRTEIYELAIDREQIIAELSLAKGAEEALYGDVAYMAKLPDSTSLECPTCGHLHEVSFHARLKLTAEAQQMHQLVLKLQARLEDVRGRETELNQSLASAESGASDVRARLNVRRSGAAMEDIVSARSRVEIKQAFDGSKRALKAEMDILEEDIAEIDSELARTEEKTRIKRIRDFYVDEVHSYAGKLGINAAEVGGRIGIGKRPPSAGSSAPRAILATHLALLATNLELDTGVVFPFVVDTPQQSGQDPDNLKRMLDVCFDVSKSGRQVLVATESLPEAWDRETQVLRFERKRQLLDEESFRGVAQTLEPLAKLMNASIEAQRAIVASIQSEEQGDEASDEGEDDGDDDAEHERTR